MGIEIANAYAEHGVTAEHITGNKFRIMAGKTTLAQTDSQSIANDVAFAYAVGKIDGRRADRERRMEPM